jgi:hypothetical protein
MGAKYVVKKLLNLCTKFSTNIFCARYPKNYKPIFMIQMCIEKVQGMVVLKRIRISLSS